jgi:hypothetical protein
MKRAIRDLLETIYGYSFLGYSGKTRTWWVGGKAFKDGKSRAFPVNLRTFYQVAKRVTMYPSRYYIEHHR